MAVDSADVRDPAMHADGFLAPQTATPLIDPATADGRLASYWRDAKRTGAVWRRPTSSNPASGRRTTQRPCRSVVYTDVATPCIDVPPEESGELVGALGAARHTTASVGLP
jgi:hypothetical protein